VRREQREDSRRTEARLGLVTSERNRAEEADAEADQIPVIARKQFVEDFGENYTPSHVTLIGPTQRGKTTLCFQLLHAVLRRHPKWKATILHGKIKGRDGTIAEWAKKDHYRIVTNWPPGPSPRPKHWKRNIPGYVHRPLKKKMPAKEEEKLLQEQFQQSIRTNYHYTGKEVRITVVDERAQADKDLRLTTDLDAPLQRGLPHNPEWNNIQRGAWVSYHCYDAPEHMFIYHDDHESNRKRYSEFGCADPDVIFRLVSKLETKKVKTGGTISQCLYMRRSDRFMCIVDT
jgi:hypothetical protein